MASSAMPAEPEEVSRGWTIEEGKVSGMHLIPEVLQSLILS